MPNTMQSMFQLDGKVEIVSNWFASLRSIWALSLDRLEDVLNTGEEE